MSTLLVVAGVGKAAVVIAADGKRTDALRAGEHLSGCKLFRCASFVFAASGLTEGPGFSAHEVAKRVAGLRLSFAEQVRTFQQIMCAALPDVVRRYEERSRTPYPVRIVLTAVFATAENAQVKRSERNFVINRATDTIECDLEADFPNANGGLGPARLFGNAAPAVLDFSRELLSRPVGPPDPIEYCKLVVEEAIRLRPDVVGPPVNIITVTRDGSGWVPGFRDPQCPELTTL